MIARVLISDPTVAMTPRLCMLVDDYLDGTVLD